MVSFWLVAVLIAGYALLIGPADYFFLHKVARRTIWTWFTFPAIIVAVSAAAYGLVYQFKGSQTRVHQADLIDIDAAGGTIRGTTWASVFHPRTEALDLSARANVPGDESASGAGGADRVAGFAGQRARWDVAAGRSTSRPGRSRTIFRPSWIG